MKYIKHNNFSLHSHKFSFFFSHFQSHFFLIYQSSVIFSIFSLTFLYIFFTWIYICECIFMSVHLWFSSFFTHIFYVWFFVLNSHITWIVQISSIVCLFFCIITPAIRNVTVMGIWTVTWFHQQIEQIKKNERNIDWNIFTIATVAVVQSTISI